MSTSVSKNNNTSFSNQPSVQKIFQPSFLIGIKYLFANICSKCFISFLLLQATSFDFISTGKSALWSFTVFEPEKVLRYSVRWIWRLWHHICYCWWPEIHEQKVKCEPYRGANAKLSSCKYTVVLSDRFKQTHTNSWKVLLIDRLNML